MDLGSVRDAYSSVSEHYIGLFDGVEKAHENDAAFIRRHLTGLPGPVLDLGCGPGHWTAYMHTLGADVTGVDVVPEFIAHARTAHLGPEFRLGSMTEVEAPEHSMVGILTSGRPRHLRHRAGGQAVAGAERTARQARVGGSASSGCYGTCGILAAAVGVSL
jgi:SAM-dependent methyltransferase